MAEGDWVQRQPGSVAGSVVPPPVPEKRLSLPKRPVRRVAEQPSAPPVQPADHDRHELPDSLRALLRPVWTPPATSVQSPAASRASGSELGGPEPEPAAAVGGGSLLRGRLIRGRTGSVRRPVTLVAVLAFVMVAAGGTAVALSNQHAGSGSGNSGAQVPGPGGSAGLTEAAEVRFRTAAWISREVSRSAIIACDAVMCATLYRAGVPAANLLLLGPAALDPLGADVVVATPVLRSLFGGRLKSVYAPAVLASFGSGPTRVQVLTVAPDGAALYEKALRQDLAARKTAGAALLTNSAIELPPFAAAELVAGRIDARLLLLLPVLAHQHPLHILAFGDQAPGASPGVPLTSVELSGSDRASGLSGRSYLRWMLTLLRGQRTPFQPAGVTSVRRGGRQIVIVRFARPTPLGLLGSG
jgi:hypothetical protein